MEVVGTSSQTEETRPVETQHVDPQAEDKVQTVEEQSHGDAKMVQAHTQTPMVCHSDQETQTDFSEAKQDDEKTQPETEEKKQDTPEAKTQNTAQTQLKQNANKDNDKAHQSQPRSKTLRMSQSLKRRIPLQVPNPSLTPK
ncbi:hypothetical protein F7725_014695 [Dissostichus mawsoni]|uniref:Uncharacterized protein n=1 Tax=Dissostichus mawsoni TaxID=36200 RepID=A0A7J5YZQ6_DISMA|nr:hypothetical protein F7725_014695 [Dissostichus mawsoni]